MFCFKSQPRSAALLVFVTFIPSFPSFLLFTCFSKVSLKTLVVLYVSLELVPARFYLYLCTCVDPCL